MCHSVTKEEKEMGGGDKRTENLETSISKYTRIKRRRAENILEGKHISSLTQPRGT